MDKQTKLLLGIGLVAAGGYLLFMQNQKKASFAGVGTRKRLSFAGVGKRKRLGMTGGVVGDRQVLSMVGQVGDRQLVSMTGGVMSDSQLMGSNGTFASYAGSNPVGRRMRMSGGDIKVQQSTFNAAGAEAPYAGAGSGFFDVQDSGWQGFTGK